VFAAVTTLSRIAPLNEPWTEPITPLYRVSPPRPLIDCSNIGSFEKLNDASVTGNDVPPTDIPRAILLLTSRGLRLYHLYSIMIPLRRMTHMSMIMFLLLVIYQI